VQKPGAWAETKKMGATAPWIAEKGKKKSKRPAKKVKTGRGGGLGKKLYGGNKRKAGKKWGQWKRR